MSDNSGSTAAARLGASCGAIFVLAILVGNQMALDGYGGVDALADVARPQTVVNATGLALELAGFVAFAFFAGWLVTHLRRGERDGWLAQTALVAAATTLSTTLLKTRSPLRTTTRFAGAASLRSVTLALSEFIEQLSATATPERAR